jgi:hypothetical protein
MAGVLLLVSFFMLHLVVIITEKGRRCWIEKKFWVSVVFVMFLLGIAIYGNACSSRANTKTAQTQTN